jgi:hypothetical protein
MFQLGARGEGFVKRPNPVALFYILRVGGIRNSF